MSDVPRTRMDRMRDWYWAFGAVCFICGAFSVGFLKFTGYYLAEQSSISALGALSSASKLAVQRLDDTDKRFLTVEGSIRELQYTDQTAANQIKELGEHVHALDLRADREGSKISEALAQQDKNSQQILLLLEPKAPRK